MLPFGAVRTISGNSSGITNNTKQGCDVLVVPKKKTIAKCSVCGKIIYAGDKAVMVKHFLRTEVGYLRTWVYCDSEDCALRMKEKGLQELQTEIDALIAMQKQIKMAAPQAIHL